MLWCSLLTTVTVARGPIQHVSVSLSHSHKHRSRNIRDIRETRNPCGWEWNSAEEGKGQITAALVRLCRSSLCRGKTEFNTKSAKYSGDGPADEDLLLSLTSQINECQTHLFLFVPVVLCSISLFLLKVNKTLLQMNRY